MGKINYGRVILSGIIAAIIINVIEDVVNGFFLGEWWNAAFAALNQPPITGGQIVLFNVWGLIIGLSAAWLYAGFRPRFGAGHHTALVAALTTWVMCYLLGYFAYAITGFPVGLMVTVAIVGLVEIVIATLVGAWFYQEA